MNQHTAWHHHASKQNNASPLEVCCQQHMSALSSHGQQVVHHGPTAQQVHGNMAYAAHQHCLL
jgi:hypothetical protein